MFHIHITLCIQYISLCLSLRAERPLHPYSFPHKLQRQASVLLTLQTDFAFKKKKQSIKLRFVQGPSQPSAHVWA